MKCERPQKPDRGVQQLGADLSISSVCWQVAAEGVFSVLSLSAGPLIWVLAFVSAIFCFGSLEDRRERWGLFQILQSLRVLVHDIDKLHRFASEFCFTIRSRILKNGKQKGSCFKIPRRCVPSVSADGEWTKWSGIRKRDLADSANHLRQRINFPPLKDLRRSKLAPRLLYKYM